MKKYMTYAVIAFFATIAISFASPDKDALIAKEKSVWQSYKEKNADGFQKMVMKDVVAVYAGGMMDMKAELDSMGKADMKSFSLTDFNVVMPAADTAIITYKAEVEGTAEGKDNSGNYNCGSVWKMKNGEWKAIFHADMKAENAAK
jgi:hypothetical protein